MREIEFRAWHPRTGMHDAKKMTDNGLTMMFDGRVLYGNFVAESGWEIMQFTGLRDKNGVKIFCGDIIEADGIDYESGNYARGEIVFIDGEFSIQYMHLDRNLYERIINAKRETVVGNKHQHPQLLEQKK